VYYPGHGITRLPVIEVHISNPSLHESFRHSLVTATAAVRVIAGKGLEGYLEALEYVVGRRPST
jgi:3-dehydroquinate dehydratase II